MTEQLVKVLSSGNVSIVVKRSLKDYFKNLLEFFINDAKKNPLDISTVDMLLYVTLINEIYLKHNTTLTIGILNKKIVLTRAQAYALWAMCQHYSDYAYSNPSMGGILLQLHQKLS